jgi:hypothetical protein
MRLRGRTYAERLYTPLCAKCTITTGALEFWGGIGRTSENGVPFAIFSQTAGLILTGTLFRVQQTPTQYTKICNFL